MPAQWIFILIGTTTVRTHQWGTEICLLNGHCKINSYEFEVIEVWYCHSVYLEIFEKLKRNVKSWKKKQVNNTGFLFFTKCQRAEYNYNNVQRNK